MHFDHLFNANLSNFHNLFTCISKLHQYFDRISMYINRWSFNIFVVVLKNGLKFLFFILLESDTPLKFYYRNFLTYFFRLLIFKDIFLFNHVFEMNYLLKKIFILGSNRKYFNWRPALFLFLFLNNFY